METIKDIGLRYGKILSYDDKSITLDREVEWWKHILFSWENLMMYSWSLKGKSNIVLFNHKISKPTSSNIYFISNENPLRHSIWPVYYMDEAKPNRTWK